MNPKPLTKDALTCTIIRCKNTGKDIRYCVEHHPEHIVVDFKKYKSAVAWLKEWIKMIGILSVREIALKKIDEAFAVVEKK